MNAGEYEKADAGLYQLTRKGKQPLTSFLFAELQSKPDNPNRSLELAYSNIHSIYPDTSVIGYKKAQKKKYAECYGFRFTNLKILHDEICSQALDSAKKTHTVTDYNNYLIIYTSSPFLKIAEVERNLLAWQNAFSENTASSIKNFIQSFPNAEQITEAKKRFDELNYMESTVGNTAAEYATFLQNNPNSPFFEDAKAKFELLQFSEETADSSSESYCTFLNQHSDNRYAAVAFKELVSKNIKSTINDCLKKLPQLYIRTELYNSIWLELLQLNINRIDSSAILHFLNEFPEFPFKEKTDSMFAMLSMKLIPIEHEGFYGFANENSDTIIYPVYDDVTEFSEGYAAVALGLEDQDVYGFINPFGQTVISFSYNEAYSFKNGLALVGAKDSSGSMKYGFINPFEAFVIPMNYQDADTFSEGVTLLQNTSGKYGFLNAQGDTVLPFAFTDANDFSEGVAPVELDTLWSFIHHDGTMAIKKVFRNAFSFSDSLAAVKDESGKWGYINHAGDWVIAPQFLSATSFNNGTATVLVLSKPTKKNKIPLQIEKVIDKTGKVIEN